MFFDIAIHIGMVLLALVLIITLYRFFRGPSLPDRVVAFDLIAYVFIGVSGVYAVLSDQKAFMDIAIVFSLVAFFGAVSFSYYLKRRREKAHNKED